MPQLSIIVASTRPGRVGLPVAQWFRDVAVAHGGFDVELLDLAEIDLPMYNEPNHPRMRKYVHQHTRDWSARIDAADALVIVHPEYNHSYNAAIKNAIDYLHGEWAYKPVGTVGYGGVAAGTRATQALKPVLSVLKMVVVGEALHIPFVRQFMTDEGTIEPNDVMREAAPAMLDELVRMEAALRPLQG